MLKRFVTLIMALMLLISAVPAFDVTALAKAMPYTIEVDLTSQMVTIRTNDSKKKIVRQCLCSSGMDDATPTGTYYLPAKTESDEREEWYYFAGFHVYAMYATRVFKGIMFHSIPCNKKKLSTVGKKDLAMFGKPASHGCIRLLWQDAEFIAKNCLAGTKCVIKKSKKADNDLRELLLQSSYPAKEGQTYAEFLGISKDKNVLSMFCTGSKVKNLQMRLRDLGIFKDKINGSYRGSTVTAVRKAQAMMGMEQSGIATKAFQKAIYSADAPASMEVTLKEDMSGPAVREMQKHLAELKLYKGDNDGIFDQDVTKAVKRFQSAYGYKTNGVATSMVQKAIYYESGRIKSMFVASGGYKFKSVKSSLYFGQVNCDVGIRLRKKPDAQSKSLRSLSNGDVVLALKYGKEWSRVQKGKKIGYVMNKYMKYAKYTLSALKYTSADGKSSYTIGHNKKDYLKGSALPCEKFATYVAKGGSLDRYKGMVEYATVTTEDDEVSLNLREQPNTSSAILEELSNGTQVRVKLHSAVWSMVQYDGKTGYLMNKFLDFWQGPKGMIKTSGSSSADEIEEELEEELEEDEEEEEEEDTSKTSESVKAIDTQYALVRPHKGSKAAVYKEDSIDAKILGGLKKGIKLKVLESVNGWNRISYNGHTGWMMDEDLKFVVAT